MHSLSQEFLALCRQLGDAQRRCSAMVADQAVQIDALQAQVLRLRAEVIVRDTRLAVAYDALAQVQLAHPGLPRRKAMARHIGALAERIASLSRECLRWRMAAQEEIAQERAAQKRAAQDKAVNAQVLAGLAGPADLASQLGRSSAHGHHVPHAPQQSALDSSLAAADLVICQTGCISHDEYWRVQDHCRRTGKPCILVDQPLAAREAGALVAVQPMVVLRMVRGQPPVGSTWAGSDRTVLNENGL